jgi:translation elongation factor EF-1beta
MKKLLLGLVIIGGLLAIVAIQYDWLNINPTDKGVNIEVDKEKAKKDIKAGAEVVKSEAQAIGSAVKEMGKEIVDKVKGTTATETKPAETKPNS